MVWQPAEGGEGVSVEEWSKQDDGDESPAPAAEIDGAPVPDAPAADSAGVASSGSVTGEAPAPVAAEEETTA